MVERAAPSRGRLRNLAGTALTVAMVLALLLVGYSCVRGNNRATYSAPAAQLAAAPQGVTYVANGTLYIVAQPDGSFIALDDSDRIRAHRLDACSIRWRPDVDGGSFLEDQRCGDARYQRDGAPLADGPAMLRHPLRLAGKRVVVDIRQCMAAAGGAVRPCTELRA